MREIRIPGPAKQISAHVPALLGSYGGVILAPAIGWPTQEKTCSVVRARSMTERFAQLLFVHRRAALDVLLLRLFV